MRDQPGQPGNVSLRAEDDVVAESAIESRAHADGGAGTRNVAQSDDDMTSTIAADILIERLVDWGVDTVIEAFMHGQPNRMTIASTLFRDKVSTLT